MEPINTRTVSSGIRHTPIKSSSAEPIVAAKNTKSVRPEFVSPKGMIDAESGVYVVQFRNASTGNVSFQYPNKKVVAEYTRSDNLVSVPEVKSQGSSSSNAVSSSVDTASVKVDSSLGQTSTSSEFTSGNPLGTTDNV
jgi:hypothetical protein